MKTYEYTHNDEIIKLLRKNYFQKNFFSSVFTKAHGGQKLPNVIA